MSKTEKIILGSVTPLLCFWNTVQCDLNLMIYYSSIEGGTNKTKFKSDETIRKVTCKSMIILKKYFFEFFKQFSKKNLNFRFINIVNDFSLTHFENCSTNYHLKQLLLFRN